MARDKNINFDISAETEDLRLIIKAFPRRGARLLGYIASAGKGILYEEFLKGQEGITLRKYPKDRTGRETVSGSVIARRSGVLTGVRWQSYPLNLFERGRKLRSGAAEPGRFILTRKFASNLRSRLPSLAQKAKSKTLGEL